MAARSRHIPKDERLASAVGMLLAVPYEHRRAMSAAELLSCIDWHHAVVPFAEGGSHEHWNIEPRWKPEHKLETATQTIPTIAKGKRLARVHEDFQRKVLSKPCGHKRAPSRWSKRKFQQRRSV